MSSLARLDADQEWLAPDPGPAAQPDHPAARMRVPSPLRAVPGPGRVPRPTCRRCERSARAANTCPRVTSPRSSQSRVEAGLGRRVMSETATRRHRGAARRSTTATTTTSCASRVSSSTSRSRRASSSAPSVRCGPSTASISRVQRRRDARPRRRVRLREDDARPHDHQADRADRGQDHLRRSRTSRRYSRRADAPDPTRRADRLPGPVRVAQPADDGARDRRRAAADPRAVPRRRRPSARRGAAANRRPEPGAREPLPARVLRRTATADRDRAGARAQPEADRARRAGLGARRLDPGAGREPLRTSCRTSSGSRTSSSRTTSPSCATSPTASR